MIHLGESLLLRKKVTRPTSLLHYRYKCSLPHILNWFRSSGCRTHLGRVRAAILQARSPHQTGGEITDLYDDFEDDESQKGKRRSGRRAADKPAVPGVEATGGGELGSGPGAPTTLRLSGGDLRAAAAAAAAAVAAAAATAAAAEDSSEEGGRAKKQKKRKGISVVAAASDTD